MVDKWLKRLARLYLPVYRFESNTMKIAYAGYSSIKMNYYARLLLDKYKHRTFSGRHWYWRIPDLIKTHNYDMIISEISPVTFNHFQKCSGYILPVWVIMRINIDRPMNEIRKISISDFSDVIRKIRKYKLTYEILDDKESFDNFKDNFYLPYITKRHGDEALLEDLNLIWNSIPSPVLMNIKEDGVVVGACLVRKEETNYSLLRLGLLNGSGQYRQHGVIGAIYYFGVLEGQRLGCKYLDVGGSRPFLTDGLTRFKMRLSAEFVPDIYSKSEMFLWLGVNKNSASANKFILSNPFMHINKEFQLTKADLGEVLKE